MKNRNAVNYYIKLSVAVYTDKKLAYRNDIVIPLPYVHRHECRLQIKKEIKARLRNSNFFISPRMDFDLVRYSNEASCNTYLRYRIVKEEKLATCLLPPAKKEKPFFVFSNR